MNKVPHFVIASIALLVLAGISTTHAAEQTRTELKQKFQDGDIPTGQDFADMIDSALNLVDDGLTVYRIGVNSSGAGLRLEAGQDIGPALTFAPKATNPPLAPLWLGQSGFLPLEIVDSSLMPHYGYLQMQMASGPLPPPPGQPGPAIFVEHLVWESDANVPMTAHSVPEPMSLVMMCGCAVVACRRRRSMA